jgi:hypothetical protein
MLSKALATVSILFKLVALEGGALGTVQQQDALLHELLQFRQL